jgi:hypothetical protein
MPFTPKCLATGIGSFPHLDPGAACGLILETVPEIPFWPQLSKLDYREQMEIQYSEGLPRIVLEGEKQRMYFDTSGDPTSDLEAFYANVVEENLEHFRISPDFSRGISAMEKRLSQADLRTIQYYKSQVTGPCTFGLTIVDEHKRAIFYNEIFRDVVIKGLTMKARWLLEKFKGLGKPQICFVDEPILTGFGSSTYVSVQRADIVSSLREVVEEIHKAGGLAGTHCCGNTDWTILADAGVDIISFDAYGYGETIAYYSERIHRFLNDGGVLAWGIVPTSEKIHQETPQSLAQKLEASVANLARKGVDQSLIWDRCLLTPSCGTGSLSLELSETVFRTLAQVSRSFRH